MRADEIADRRIFACLPVTNPMTYYLGKGVRRASLELLHSLDQAE